MKPKRWQALVRKVSYLGLDLEDRQEVIDENTRAFDDEVRKAMGLPTRSETEPTGETSTDLALLDDVSEAAETQVNPSPAAEKPADESQVELPPPAEDEAEVPESIRKLWRSIAMVLHPDKTGNDPDLAEMFKTASAAWKAKQFEKLLDLAIDLGLPLPDPDDALVELMQARAKRIGEKIQHFEGLIIWQWIHASDKEREAIVKRVAEHLRKKQQQKK